MSKPTAQYIMVRVTPFEKRRLIEIAERNGKTISDFIREAVNEITIDCDDSAIMKLRKKPAA
jgi:predicted DNA-binding protein